jgi:hypothetical protein
MLDQRARAQSLSWTGVPLKLTLAKEIKDAVLLAISPDDRRICLWFTKTTKAKADSSLIVVLEIGTWKEIYSTRLPGEPMGFSFFLGGDALYGVTEPRALARKLSDRKSLVIDLRTGEVDQQAAPVTPDIAYYSAFSRGVLIGIRGPREIVRAEWPSFRELASIQVDGRRRGGLSLSGDRQRLIHVGDQSLVCRRTDDFGIVWIRKIDASINMGATLRGQDVPGASLSVAYSSSSADGGIVALGARRVKDSDAPLSFYIEILDGKDGGVVSRWPENPGDGIALSPDGKLLAIASLEQSPYVIEAVVNIHDVPSGKKVATAIHDRVSSNRRLGVMHSHGFGFTPDGDYLITANSNRVKIWRVDRDSAQR